MKIKTLLATAAISTVALFSGSALAATPSKVTIKGTNGDMYGKVKSGDSDCLADRKVTVYEYNGKPNPKTDYKVAYDTTDEYGNWSIGNSGYTDSYFYAHVKRSPGCGSAISKVISQ